jgi:hypothetical protein
VKLLRLVELKHLGIRLDFFLKTHTISHISPPKQRAQQLH